MNLDSPFGVLGKKIIGKKIIPQTRKKHTFGRKKEHTRMQQPALSPQPQ